MKTQLKPSDFLKQYPYDSVFKSSQEETVAINILRILKNTENEFRELKWEEYKSENVKYNFEENKNKKCFFRVLSHTTSAEKCALFCKDWYEIMYPKQKSIAEMKRELPLGADNGDLESYLMKYIRQTENEGAKIDFKKCIDEYEQMQNIAFSD